MPWQIIHGRDRELLVRGAESGHPAFTREADRALRFTTQDAARQWISNVLTHFCELALLREAGGRDTRKGTASHYGRRKT